MGVFGNLLGPHRGHSSAQETHALCARTERGGEENTKTGTKPERSCAIACTEERDDQQSDSAAPRKYGSARLRGGEYHSDEAAEGRTEPTQWLHSGATNDAR